ncbi:MAG TPA: ABC transporter permease [Hypericibacter adhaerens]|jgi:ABC-2 type transport system permease protein|uniref:ABC transporter permease n=1 Tax=Hypericibacter adhaerens TaxID=2602016 RepID=A0A5J6MUR2_9PROT|nr:ABC transporter permease [Hypericibacter adhaerens]QEX20485.1 ABC transporter permease [Hypericibacter adhaerens]HWA46130.1 ABC transporter permease [Hypericibacter adhaerens]
MLASLLAIYRLGVKELYSLRHDRVMVILIIWAFSLSVYTAAEGISHELRNASVGIVDLDRSQLSLRFRDAMLPPQFQPPAMIRFDEIDPDMDSGRYTFVLVIPADFESDLLAGRRPELQLDIDATAMMQAGIGATYFSNIVAQEVTNFLRQDAGSSAQPVELHTRIAFNPNLESAWFTSVMQLINSITMLSVVLTGAALIREREHGTIEHLLVMPLTSFEIMMAKIWSNALVIVVATAASLWLVVERLLAVPIEGSIPLYLAGVALYLFSSTAIGIFLATLARSMPQFGLLFILVILPMNLLSGGQTPIESQPEALQKIMQLVPSTHFVRFSQAILYRGAGIDAVWLDFAATAVAGIVLLILAGLRFRRSIAALQG